MPKAYLRYKGEGALGAIVSPQGNVVVTSGNSPSQTAARYAFCPTNDTVTIWDIRTQTIKGVMEVPLGKDELQKRPPQVTALSDLFIPSTTASGWAGAKMAVGYSDGSIRVFAYEEMKPGSVEGVWSPEVSFMGHRTAVNVLKFSRGGFQLCSGGADNDVIVWDVVAETGMCRLSGHKDQVTDLALLHENESPDASLAYVVSVSKDTTCKLWSIGTQICVQTCGESRGELWSVASSMMMSSPSQAVEGAPNSGTVVIVTGGVDQKLYMYTVSALSLSSGGGLDATGDMMKFIGPLDRGSGQSGMKKRVGTLAFTEDGSRLLAQAVGRTVEVFDMLTDKYRKRVQRRKREKAAKKQKAAATGQDGINEQPKQQPQGEDDSTEKALTAAELFKLRDKLVHFPGKIGSMSVHKDSVCVGLLDNSLHLIPSLTAELAADDDSSAAVEKGRMSVVAKGHRQAVRYVSFSPDSTMLLSCSGESLRVWTAQSTKQCVRHIDNTGYVLCARWFAGNQHVVCGSKDGSLALYDLQTGECRCRTPASEGGQPLYGICDDPEEQDNFITVGADKTLRYYGTDFASLEDESSIFVEDESKRLTLNDDGLCVALSPKDKKKADAPRFLAIGMLDSTITVVYADTGKQFLTLYGHQLPVLTVAFSDDGQLLASGSADKNIKLWHPKFGNCLHSLRAHESSVTSITWLPGTHYLASVGKVDGMLKLWDCDRSEEIASLPGHNGDVWSVACDADGALLATGGADRSIRLWKRSDEQMFIEEEQEEALDRQLEEEAAREAAVVTMARPTRRTMETVKSAERLMEALDEVREASTEEQQSEEERNSTPQESIKTLRIMAAIPVADMQEVVLALPVTYSRRLLSVLVDLLSFLHSVPESQQAAIRGGLPIELCLSVGLSLIQAQAPYLVHDPSSRRLLVDLRDLLYDVASTAVDEAGVARSAAMMAKQELKRRREIGDLDAEDRAYRKSRRIAGK
ncbi:Dip2/Utp12 protein [Perkinsus olseni]|uniref:Dip2/Utp12 protein n=1 Tax=Perkinsus olseni TaxID=32597 RepID=A0A7J6NQP5_PEROL|nr:Dip2/Utp12 protein [Perkinsus olseni]